MTPSAENFVIRKSVAAVWCALLTLAAVPAIQAAEPEAAATSAATASQEPSADELTRPTNKVEIGAEGVSKSSAKFGEYNGLGRSGGYAIGNVDVRGGGYNSDDPTRWRVQGTDLGLETRNASGEFGQQGIYRFNFGYDELLRNKSDTFQTPYLGAGSNRLSLPSNWITPGVPTGAPGAGAISTNNFRGLIPGIGTAPYINANAFVTPSAAQAAKVQALQNADLPDFQNVSLYTKRKTYDGGVSYIFDRQWDIAASVRHQHKEGLKAMGALNTGTSPSSIIPDLIDQSTDQYNLSLNFKGEKSFFQAAYYGSIFKNGVTQMNFQNPFSLATPFSDISSPPSNQFHQLNLTGGYNLSPTTKLVVNGSYARSTQNDAFINDGVGTLPLGLPVPSLDGLVVTKAFNMKLTGRPNSKLNLAAGYKYDNRDNQTPVNIYTFYDAGEAKSGTSPFNSALGSNINIYSNRPYSKKLNQVDLDADYNVAKGHWLKGGYQYQQTDNYCNGSWYNCAQATQMRENTLRAEWRTTAVEDLTGRVGYAYSQRRVDYDENAWLSLVPMANVIPSGRTQSVYQVLQQFGIGGFGFPGAYGQAPANAAANANFAAFFPNNSALQQQFYGSRNDIHELPGMRRYLMADRNRDKLRTSLNWQANEKLSLFGGVDFNRDDYNNSVYGLKEAKSWALNLDGTFAANDDLTFSLFYTYEDQRANSAGTSYNPGSLVNTGSTVAGSVSGGGCFNTVQLVNMNSKVDPCLNWTADMRDKVNTLGISAKRRNLLGGKLDVSGDLIYSQARTDNAMTGGTYSANPLVAVNPPSIFIPAQNLPTVKTDSIALRLNSRYTVDKQSSVQLFYRFQHLRATDYAYDAMQTSASISSVLPTNEQAPVYKIHVIGVSYIYSFR
jgi:hypothetical protein